MLLAELLAAIEERHITGDVPGDLALRRAVEDHRETALVTSSWRGRAATGTGPSTPLLRSARVRQRC